MNRCGSFAAVVSSRVQTTEDAVAFPLSETNRRPVFVETQIVPVLLGVRAMRETKPPSLSAPYAADVRSVAPAGPMRTKSPQVGVAALVVNSGQFASRKSRSPPQSCVRQTLCEPWKIDFASRDAGRR